MSDQVWDVLALARDVEQRPTQYGDGGRKCTPEEAVKLASAVLELDRVSEREATEGLARIEENTNLQAHLTELLNLLTRGDFLYDCPCCGMIGDQGEYERHDDHTCTGCGETAFRLSLRVAYDAAKLIAAQKALDGEE